ASPRARPLAWRSARDPTASAAERLAPDLRLLHDFRSAHFARRAARALYLRLRGGARGPLARLFRADAARALHLACPPFAVHHPHRPNPAGAAILLDGALSGTCSRGSFPMTSKTASRLKVGVAAGALLALAALAGPAWGFCGFYVAQADAKLFNKSSK